MTHSTLLDSTFLAYEDCLLHHFASTTMTMKLQTTVITLLILISTHFSLAQQEQQTSTDKLAEILKRFPDADANQDGSLTIEELRAFRSERPQPSAEQVAKFFERFPEADTNGDGTLTLEEIRAYNQEHRPENNERPTPRLKRPDPTYADVKYGDHERQTFDLWLAESKDGNPTPLVVFIHGGGFRSGSKANVNVTSLQTYLDAGISFAAINYRLSDVGPYPIMMHDAARALQTIRSRAGEWILDAERVACFGGSAGAGISLWLGFHDDLADPESDDPIARQSTRIVAAGTGNGQSTYDIKTHREWFGVPDLEPHEAMFALYAIQSPEDWESERVRSLMADASPINHLTKDDVPVYMVYSSGDVPVDKTTSAGVWVHHVKLGLKLQEAMAPLGLECVIQSPDHPEETYGSQEAFIIQKLTE